MPRTFETGKTYTSKHPIHGGDFVKFTVIARSARKITVTYFDDTQTASVFVRTDAYGREHTAIRAFGEADSPRGQFIRA